MHGMDVMDSMKSCGSTVQSALAAVPGVSKAEVRLDKSRHVAVVWGSQDTTALVDAVEAVGFEAKPIEEDAQPDVSLTVEGMMW